MHIQQKEQTYPLRQTALPVGAITAMGAAGAIIGGTAAAAKDLRQVKSGEMTREAAAGHILKEALGSGLATAAGAVAGTFFRSNVLGLAAMAVVGVGAKYLYDGVAGLAAEKAKTAATSVAKTVTKTAAKAETAKPAKA